MPSIPARSHPTLLSLALLASALLACAGAQTTAQGRPRAAAPTCGAPNTAAGAYAAVVEGASPALRELLRQLPKGADLHNHLSGSVQPEDYVAMGTADGDCYGQASDDRTQLAIHAPASGGGCNAGDAPLASASPADRQRLVQSLSMYEYPYPSIQAGHDQFFATFGRFGPVSGTDGNKGKMLAKTLQQARADAVGEVETMLSFRSDEIRTLASRLRAQYPDPASFADASRYSAMYAFLEDHGLADIAARAEADAASYARHAADLLGCASSAPDPACSVGFRFVSAVNRNSASGGAPDLASIFAQTALSFLLAEAHQGVGGVNLVSGEDQPVSMQTFPVQMQLFRYFHAQFPSAPLALHGGELTPCFVEDRDALRTHLTGAIDAGARRLGHGVSFMYLTPDQQAAVASLMKQNDVPVEINLASNAQILGVTGDAHPFPVYVRRYRVPAVLSTDDEGVSHGDFTSAWVYAALAYRLSYDEVVTLARNSVQYSFLPGPSLWAGEVGARTVNACAGLPLGGPVAPGSPCEAFLQGSARARAQWAHEAALAQFERTWGATARQLLPGARASLDGGPAPRAAPIIGARGVPPDHMPATSTTACAKSLGASWGRSCPTPPPTSRCS